MSRVLANKCALAIRVDALGDADTSVIGGDARGYVEGILSALEGRTISTSVKAKKTKSANIEKYDSTRDAENPQIAKSTASFNPASDSTMSTPKKNKKNNGDMEVEKKKEKKEKKEKKTKKAKKDKKEKKEKKSKKDEKPKKRKRDSEGQTPKKKKKNDENDF